MIHVAPPRLPSERMDCAHWSRAAWSGGHRAGQRGSGFQRLHVESAVGSACQQRRTIRGHLSRIPRHRNRAPFLHHRPPHRRQRGRYLHFPRRRLHHDRGPLRSRRHRSADLADQRHVSHFCAALPRRRHRNREATRRLRSWHAAGKRRPLRRIPGWLGVGRE